MVEREECLLDCTWPTLPWLDFHSHRAEGQVVLFIHLDVHVQLNPTKDLTHSIVKSLKLGAIRTVFVFFNKISQIEISAN